MTDLPPQIMGDDSVGWWHHDITVGAAGGIVTARNRVRRPNQDVLGVGNLSQSDPALRPAHGVSDMTFDDDYLGTARGDLVAAGSTPQIWMIVEIPEQAELPLDRGLLDLFNPSLDLTTGRGLTVFWKGATGALWATMNLGNAFWPSIKITGLLPGLKLVKVVVESDRFTLSVGSRSVSSAASGADGSRYLLDYMTLGRFVVHLGEPGIARLNWTGKINEAFLSSVNADTDQDARMTQYFEGLYPEITS